MKADYDSWLTKEYEAEQEAAARLEGISDACVRELLAGELDVMDFASDDDINALFKALCAIAYKNVAPAIRINEIQLELSQFADEQGMTHAAEVTETINLWDEK